MRSTSAGVLGQPGAPFWAQARQSGGAIGSPVTSHRKPAKPAWAVARGMITWGESVVAIWHTSELRLDDCKGRLDTIQPPGGNFYEAGDGVGSEATADLTCAQLMADLLGEGLSCIIEQQTKIH
ncbi:MAG: hypothetical protein ACXWMH_06570 [Syntrophales bacterium]